jgi:hypothetical protein
VPDRPAADGRLTRAWQSLAKADELVQGFGERGWIAEATLTVVRGHTHELARRVGRLEERGAAAADEDPAVLARELEELTDLLVALSDEAVTAQPSLAPDVPVVVTLADAQRRLGATHALYDELG